MRRGIACAGNWIVDIVHTIDAWPRKSDLVHIREEITGVGGGAANVALDLAAFGVDYPVVPIGLVGTDLHAATVREALAASGLPDHHLHATALAPTAHTHVMTVPGDSRTFFYHPGTNDLFAEGDVPVEALAGLRLFYLGYLNLMATMDRVEAGGSTQAARVLGRAQAAGLVTCVDLVSSDLPDFARTVAAALPVVDYLFLNEVEAARATGLVLGGPEDRAGMLAAAQALRAGGAGTVILHSERLSLWLGAETVWSPAPRLPPERIRSPVGAGDAFCAGCLHGLHEGWPPERSLALAHRAAAAALSGATATDGIPRLGVLLAPERP